MKLCVSQKGLEFIQRHFEEIQQKEMYLRAKRKEQALLEQRGSSLPSINRSFGGLLSPLKSHRKGNSSITNLHKTLGIVIKTPTSTRHIPTKKLIIPTKAKKSFSIGDLDIKKSKIFTSRGIKTFKQRSRENSKKSSNQRKKSIFRASLVASFKKRNSQMPSQSITVNNSEQTLDVFKVFDESASNFNPKNNFLKLKLRSVSEKVQKKRELRKLELNLQRTFQNSRASTNRSHFTNSKQRTMQSFNCPLPIKSAKTDKKLLKYEKCKYYLKENLKGQSISNILDVNNELRNVQSMKKLDREQAKVQRMYKNRMKKVKQRAKEMRKGRFNRDQIDNIQQELKNIGNEFNKRVGNLIKLTGSGNKNEPNLNNFGARSSRRFQRSIGYRKNFFRKKGKAGNRTAVIRCAFEADRRLESLGNVVDRSTSKKFRNGLITEDSSVTRRL